MTAPSPIATETPFLSLRGMSKHFPGGVIANEGIDLDLYAGEVHAILGENGAGKSTLMKTLYGFYRPDAGAITLRGQTLDIHSPEQAKRLGIGMVFQNLMLVPALSVVENVELAVPSSRFALNKRKTARRIQEVAERYGFEIDPWAMVWQLSPGDEQKVEIVKALLAEARLLIFDEPTSVLAPHEVQGLYQVFARLKQDGYAVVFITHKMREVLACADRITVLQRGRVTGSIARAEATEQVLVQMIFGREVTPEAAALSGLALATSRHAPPVQQVGRPAVELREAVVNDDRGGLGLKQVSLSLYPGEIIGVAGVSGSGQKELGDALLGLRTLRNGELLVDGEDARHWTPKRFLERGVACVPEDPLEMCVVGSMSVLHNLALGDRSVESRVGWRSVSWETIKARVEALTARFSLRMPRLDVPIETLSGGNVQRAVFARELSRQPKVLIAFYPSRGLDIAGVQTVHKVLRACRESGDAVLLISEDLDELVEMSDRLAVMYHGEIVATLPAAGADLHQVGLMMTGGRHGHEPAPALVPESARLSEVPA
jgi:general nucleoside transport system ATP-binding protein